MFPDIEYSFNGLKHLTEKVTAVASLTRVRVVVDHTMSTPPDNKVKDLALLHCNFDQCLHRTPSFVKKHLEQAFFYVFFYSHLLNEMFIVNGKYHFCNDTFTDVQFTSLLA